MTDAIEAVYPKALDAGIDAERFWGLSMREILDTIDASTRREKRRAEELQAELRLYAGLLYRHAQLVAVATWSGKRYPSLEKAFPGLMKPDDDDTTEPAVPLWKRQQAGMAAWVAVHNERIAQRKKVSDDGGSTGAGNQG